MEKLDSEESPAFNNAGVQAALEKLEHHPELEVGFMVMGRHTQPAYNLQSAVDAEHALIIAYYVVLDATINRSLEPMAAAARTVLGKEPSMSLRTRATPTESRQPSVKTMASCQVSATRTRNPHGDGTFFQCDAFRYQPESDTYLCPGEKTLKRKARLKKDKSIIYLANAKDCGDCSLKRRCTVSTARRVSRHMFEESLTRMNERATAATMRLRRSVVEHPFATIKYRILGHPRLLLRGRAGAHTELSLAVMAYKPKTDGERTRSRPSDASASEKLIETAICPSNQREDQGRGR